MARLAIIIGVSENSPPLKKLSACANDCTAIFEVLKQTGRFDDLLLLSSKKETTSAATKEKLTAFVKQHKGAEVDELFFYFSGHGDFVGDEFYHILSDYDSKARNRTSLLNSELDAMMRGLNPKLFVKIVDACHSGTSYIKSNEGLGDYLKGHQTGFQDLYFLYSSQSNQISWTAGALSAFTKCILSEAGRKDTGAVRYRDLMSAAADYFETSGDQTPHFVTQADFTQIFCESSSNLQDIIHKFAPPPLEIDKQPQSQTSEKHSSSLKELIQLSDKQYSSKKETNLTLKRLDDFFSESALSKEIADIFDWNSSTSEDKMDNMTAIGDWLSKNANRDFFADPKYKTIKYKKRQRKNMSPFLRTLSFAHVFERFASDDETELVDATRLEVSSYENTCDLLYQKITVHLQSKHKSVLPLECYVLPIISPSHLRLFWAIQQFKLVDWDTTIAVGGPIKWTSEEVSLKKEKDISTLFEQVQQSFTSSVDKIIYSKWPEAKPKIDR